MTATAFAEKPVEVHISDNVLRSKSIEGLLDNLSNVGSHLGELRASSSFCVNAIADCNLYL